MPCTYNINQVQREINTHILQYSKKSTNIQQDDFQKMLISFKNRLGSIINEDTVDNITEQLIKTANLFRRTYPKYMGYDYIRDFLLQGKSTINITKELKTIEDIDEVTYSLRKKTFIDEYYGNSIASEYMLDMFTRDFVRNTLVDITSAEVKAAGDIYDVNENLSKYQDSLYKDLKTYIENNPDIHTISMPDSLFNNDGTNNFKVLFHQLETIFGKEQNSPETISRKYLSTSKADQAEFEAMTKYFILKHFDQLVIREFGDFLNIGEVYYGKHTLSDIFHTTKKYTFNTEHDYQNSVSWQTDERATPRDVMSHHLQYALNTIPYIDESNTQRGYLDTDVVIYSIKALKDIYLKKKMKNDAPFHKLRLEDLSKKSGSNKINYTDEEKLWIKSIGTEVYLSDLIDSLRDNPQLGYSVLFKVLKSDLIIGNEEGTFNKDLLNIFNSLYTYVFADNRLQRESPDIYQELTHFLDFTTNLENTQFFTNPDGEWSIRTMNPMNVDLNKYILSSSINSTHVSGQMDYLMKKYNVQFHEKSTLKNVKLQNSEKYVEMSFKTINPNKITEDIEYTIQYYPALEGKERIKVFKKDNPYVKSELTKPRADDYESFKDFIKDAIQVNLNSNKDLNLEILRDTNYNYNLILENLLRLSGSVLGNAFIFRKDLETNKRALDRKAKSWGLNNNSRKDVAFSNKYATYDLIGKSESHLVTWLATLQGIAKRQMSKSTIRTAEQTTVAANSLTNLSAERKNQYKHFNTESAVKLDMLSDILGWGNNREVNLGIGAGGKQTHNFNFNELFYSSFCIDYLTGYKNANGKLVSRFVEAVNSDKGNSPRIEVDRSELFNALGLPLAAETFYGIYENPDSPSSKGHKATFGKIYLNSWTNVKNDFKTLETFLKQNENYKKFGLTKDFRFDIENNFENFNTQAEILGLTGNELLNRICLEYNKQNFNNPIAIIENVHKRGNKKIELNKAFITNLMRFNSNDSVLSKSIEELKPLQEKYVKNDPDGYWKDQQDLENYFRLNELRLVDDLLTEGARLNIGTIKEATGWKQVLNYYDGWKDSNNDMVFAKIRAVNKLSKEIREFNINDYSDLIGFSEVQIDPDTGSRVIVDSSNPSFNFAGNLEHPEYEIIGIDVHPALRSWTAAEGLYTGKSQTANVGLTVFSDAKRAKNTRLEEEGAVGDYVKRNVINTATMKQFMLNSLTGITDEVKIAIIEDIKADLNNMVTDEQDYKVWDGATFTNSFQHYWENNSLSGSITGFTKKPIMHYYFDKYAAGYLGKTASFAINNEKMRDSVLFRAMHFKTSDIKWRNEDNTLKDADITKSYMGRDIAYSDCKYEKNGRFYEIWDIKKVDTITTSSGKTVKAKPNTYAVKVTELRQDGTHTENMDTLYYTIDSNYTLWQALGGYNSVELNYETNRLEYSENSIRKVAEVANLVGDIRSGLDPEKTFTQQGVYQFMKHSNIHYIATEGAVKKGAANINKFNKNENSILDSGDLNFFKISSRNFGIQLDPTHQADNAEVSLMTQVISGLADRGFTSDAVHEVYTALGRLAREAVHEDLEKYKESLGNDESLESKVANEIASAFMDQLGTANNLILNIAQKIIDLPLNANKAGIIPWSDPSIFKLVASSITSTLNKMAIRVKSFGSLSVLNPSHGTIQLFGNKKLSEYSSALNFYNAGIDLRSKSTPIKNHKLYLGHWYTYKENGVDRYVKMDLKNYYNITEKLDNGEIKDGLRETFLGREIEIPKDQRNKHLFGLFKLYSKGKEQPLITFIDGSLKDVSKKLVINPESYDRVVQVEMLGRDLDTFNVFVNNGENTLYDLKSVKARYDLKSQLKDGTIDSNTYKIQSHRLLREIQKDFNKIKQQSTITNDKEKTEIDFINGSKKVNSYETSAYGVLVPMIYKTKFGLRDSDNLSDIINDEEFFFKRLLQNYADLNLENKRVVRGNYDIVIKSLSNKNLYLQTKTSNDINDNSKLQEIETDIRQLPNGKFYRYDLQGNRMYEVSSKLDKVFIDYSSNNFGEVIVTDDAGMQFYIDKYARDASDIQIEKKNEAKEPESSFSKRINKILAGTELFKKLENSKQQLTYDNLSSDDVGFVNNYLTNGMDASGMKEAIQTNLRYRKLWEKGQKIRTSFIESLNFLAARIPAQSMQSFMKMKVEGFTNVGVNDCYISDMQVWLQGSDFDVDKVTLMGISLTNSGLLKTWSKYIRFYNQDEYKITSKIEFPTGVKTKVVDSDSMDHHKYASLFKNGKLNIKRPDSIKYNTFKTLTDEVNEKIKDEESKYYNKLKLLVDMLNEYKDTLSGVKDELRNNIEEVVNDNNLQEIRDIDETLMHLVQYRANEISSDISNIIASQNPIDVVADPLKKRADESNFGRKDIYNRYGNAVVKLRQLLTNHTGKMGISITAATGIKTFFALTQFFNHSLKNNLSLELLDNLSFNVKIAGKEYHTISNLNEIEITPDMSSGLKKAATEFNKYIRESDIVDADAVISAIMTLATDNAKELKLGKLNASSEILGLYLYGVTIGVPFDVLANIFTSNTADVLNKRMHGNVFTDRADIKLSSAINWLVKGPSQPMRKTRDGEWIVKDDLIDFLSYDYTGKVGNEQAKSIVQIFNKIKENIAKDYEISKDDSEESKTLAMRYRSRAFGTEVQKLLTAARNITSDDWEVNRYKGEVIEYIKAMYKIYGDGNFDRNDLSDITQLLNGSKEIGTLRSLILNKGVPVLIEDKLGTYDSFSEIIQQALPSDTIYETDKHDGTRRLYTYNGKNTYKLDLVRYRTDEQYKQIVIDAYEDLKHTINPFRVVEGLPHYSSYLDVAADDAMRLSLSSVFRAIRNNSNLVFDTYGVFDSKSKKKYYKRMEDFFIRKLQDEFLKTITIRLDDNTLVKNGDVYENIQGNPIVTLGTPEGNAAFKNWVESTLLRKLQNNDEYFTVDNTFVNDLMPKLYTKTATGNKIRGLSLPVDMIPKTELENKLFNRYQIDYLELCNQKLLTDDRYSLADIFYLYNMITYGNSRNMLALTSITDALYGHPSKATWYSRFLANFDSNNNIHVVKDPRSTRVKRGDLVISQEELFMQIAPDSFEIQNKGKFRGPYVRLLNSNTGIKELHKLKQEVIDEDNAKKQQKIEKYRSRLNDNFEEVPDDVYEEPYQEVADYESYGPDSDDLDLSLETDDVYDDYYDDQLEYAEFDDGTENKVSFQSVRRDWQLVQNYEPMQGKGKTLDNMVLSTLGRYAIKQYRRTETIPEITSEDFGHYLINNIIDQVQQADHNGNIEIEYFNKGHKYAINVDVTSTGKNQFNVQINNDPVQIINAVAGAKVSSSVYSDLDYVMVRKLVLDSIKKQHNIEC